MENAPPGKPFLKFRYSNCNQRIFRTDAAHLQLAGAAQRTMSSPPLADPPLETRQKLYSTSDFKSKPLKAYQGRSPSVLYRLLHTLRIFLHASCSLIPK